MLEAVGLSDPGCIRTNNEDYYLLAPPLDLYLVADGMGGAQAGEQASKLAGDTVAEYLWKAREIRGGVLLDAFHEANRRVLRAAENDPNLHGMGTTLTASWKVGNELLVANVGDSRAYLFKDRRLQIITEDQTWVNEVGRPLGLSEEALKTHPMRHVLTMAIGVSDTLRIHSYVVPLQPGALFLLSSDGLHGVLTQEKMAAILSGGAPLNTLCDQLVQAAREAGGPDNITAVLIQSGNNGR